MITNEVKRLQREIHALTGERGRLQAELDATNTELDAARLALARATIGGPLSPELVHKAVDVSRVGFECMSKPCFPMAIIVNALSLRADVAGWDAVVRNDTFLSRESHTRLMTRKRRSA